ncbi:MetQ/NlpA family ABC transporter substrate-binding protein [Aliicoccus persicus]|uniref:D-methionine transport system substrate-binding protein n=1 Tax=Aliicoccus persicus TaxID=930138 RepID=A0A662Z573_9STAP|nr:MetQ/NlpA family ABC transporter substrate-binding protein [Aliicoccus persicus]SEW01352.1 D-methionine transport system substrate-binding protein [Aliicoccus persicus]
MKLNKFARFTSIAAASVIAFSTLTSGAYAQEDDEVVIKIGASPAPHAEILEEAAKILEEEGIVLDISVINDYVTPNRLLYEEELDANFFQHIPFLDNDNETNDYDLVNLGPVHIEPIAVYSQDYESITDLPDGATILVSNNVADEGRILSFFLDEGLIEIEEGIEIQDARFEDITENPHNFDFNNNSAPELLVNLYEYNEGDVTIINSNFAIDGDLNPVEDSIAIEDGDSPYVNVIAVRNGDEEREELVRLLEVLQSEEIQTFIEETYDGAVIPVDDTDDDEDEEAEDDEDEESEDVEEETEEDTEDEEDEE